MPSVRGGAVQEAEGVSHASEIGLLGAGSSDLGLLEAGSSDLGLLVAGSFEPLGVVCWWWKLMGGCEGGP